MSKVEAICATVCVAVFFGGLTLTGMIEEHQKTVRYTECVKYHQPQECQ